MIILTTEARSIGCAMLNWVTKVRVELHFRNERIQTNTEVYLSHCNCIRPSPKGSVMYATINILNHMT